MRDELSRSVKGLPDGTKYQLIFFSGPAWVAGDEVTNIAPDPRQISLVVRHSLVRLPQAGFAQTLFDEAVKLTQLSRTKSSGGGR